MYLMSTSKNKIFYRLNSSNEYRWDDKSAIQLEGIPTFLLRYYLFLIKYENSGLCGPGAWVKWKIRVMCVIETAFNNEEINEFLLIGQTYRDGMPALKITQINCGAGLFLSCFCRCLSQLDTVTRLDCIRYYRSAGQRTLLCSSPEA
jgi:hypothetical protein